MLIFSKEDLYIKDLYTQLAKYLEIQDLGEANYYLGLKFIKNEKDNSVYLSQKGFIKRLLHKYDKLDIKPHITPYILGTKLSNNVL